MESQTIYIGLVCTIIWAILRHLLIPKRIPGIPYNSTSYLMPWGELVSLGIHQFRTGEVFNWFSLQCLRHKSPIVQLFIPPFSTTYPVVVISDLHEIEDIVTKRMKDIDRANLMHETLGALVPKATIGMKTDDGWKEQRRLWNVVLSPTFLEETVAPVLWEFGLKLADLWGEKAGEKGKEVAFEVMEDVKMATLDGVWKIAVGNELGLLSACAESLQSRESRKKESKNRNVKMRRKDFYEALKTLLACLDWITQGISPRMYRWIFRHTPWFRKAERVKDVVLDQLISDARIRVQRDLSSTSMTGRNHSICAIDQVLLRHNLLDQGKQSENESTSDVALRDELLELLITGHETTSSSIGWSLKYLADHPRAQDQLRTLLHEAFPNASSSNMPAAEHIIKADIPYLDAVIAEVLRCSNTGPISFRQAVRDCDILGHRIKSGTPIILMTDGASYDSSEMSWTPEHLRSLSSRASLARKNAKTGPATKNPIRHDAALFVPERWLNEEGEFCPNSIHSLPFSAGPRGCFGKKIALLEMRLILAILVMRFKFPMLSKDLSRYGARDGLTRRPTCCFVRPMAV